MKFYPLKTYVYKSNMKMYVSFATICLELRLLWILTEADPTIFLVELPLFNRFPCCLCRLSLQSFFFMSEIASEPIQYFSFYFTYVFQTFLLQTSAGISYLYITAKSIGSVIQTVSLAYDTFIKFFLYFTNS